MWQTTKLLGVYGLSHLRVERGGGDPPTPRAPRPGKQPREPKDHSAKSGCASRVALVIGNSEYSEPVASLSGVPKKDAEAVAEELRQCGFELVGGGAQCDLSYDSMCEVLEEFETLLREKEEVFGLFYFAVMPLLWGCQVLGDGCWPGRVMVCSCLTSATLVVASITSFAMGNHTPGRNSAPVSLLLSLHLHAGASTPLQPGCNPQLWLCTPTHRGTDEGGNPTAQLGTCMHHPHGADV